MLDVNNASTLWLDVYALSGITPGKGMIIQNKKNNELLVLEGATNPGENVYDGRVITYLKEIEITEGSPGVWVRATINGPKFFVQET